MKVAGLSETEGSAGVLKYLQELKPAPGMDSPSPASQNSTPLSVNPASSDVLYILRCIRALCDLIKESRRHHYTERHIDLKLFGTILQPLGYYIFSEVQSRVSKLVRQASTGNRNKSRYLVDYLMLVNSFLGSLTISIRCRQTKEGWKLDYARGLVLH
jgi:hypothetical protein